MEDKKKIGKPKKIESPEKLLEHFERYEKETKNNPFLVKDYVGKDGNQVWRERERALTIEGFECWLFDNKILNDLGDYLKNKDGRYTDYAPICTHIKRKTRKDQIEGGLAGIYNPSITQRLNNLTERTDVTTDGKAMKSEAIKIQITPPLEELD